MYFLNSHVNSVRVQEVVQCYSLESNLCHPAGQVKAGQVMGSPRELWEPPPYSHMLPGSVSVSRSSREGSQWSAPGGLAAATRPRVASCV